MYAFVPKMIKYYLDQDPILPNVPTYLGVDPKECEYILANLPNKLVVKAVNESGGYGMLMGPHSTKEEQEFRQRIRANPRNYIAQPVLNLSRHPVFQGDHFEGRHIDSAALCALRRPHHVVPGGLTRVALRPAPSWSIPARAAAARTPGCSQSPQPQRQHAGRAVDAHRPKHRRRGTLLPALPPRTPGKNVTEFFVFQSAQPQLHRLSHRAGP
jgi:hypothetical protein